MIPMKDCQHKAEHPLKLHHQLDCRANAWLQSTAGALLSRCKSSGQSIRGESLTAKERKAENDQPLCTNILP